MNKIWQDDMNNIKQQQFAHGHEELRALNNHIRDMKKLEDVQMQMTKSKCSPLSSPYSPSNLLSSDSKTSTPPSTASSTSKPTKPSPLLSKDWSPMDDGIAVSLPGSMSMSISTIFSMAQLLERDCLCFVTYALTLSKNSLSSCWSNHILHIRKID